MRDLLILVFVLIQSAQSLAQQAPTCARQVPVFDSLWYRGKPSMAHLGLSEIFLFAATIDPKLDEKLAKFTRDVSSKNARPVIVLDIELHEYPFDIRAASQTEVDHSMAFAIHLIQVIKAVNPNARVGIYQILPLRDYWTPNLYASALRHDDAWWRHNRPQFITNYVNWLKANQYLKPLAAKVDYTFPSLYTFYDENLASSSWSVYAQLNIAEARKYGKPVIPFLWPQFHDAGPYKDFRYIPNDFFRRQMAFLRYRADGMVLWGSGYFRKENWDENASWWKSIKEYVQTIPLDCN